MELRFGFLEINMNIFKTYIIVCYLKNIFDPWIILLKLKYESHKKSDKQWYVLYLDSRINYKIIGIKLLSELYQTENASIRKLSVHTHLIFNTLWNNKLINK